MKKILITGVNGQIGSELSEKLETIVGAENIVGSTFGRRRRRIVLSMKL